MHKCSKRDSRYSARPRAKYPIISAYKKTDKKSIYHDLYRPKKIRPVFITAELFNKYYNSYHRHADDKHELKYLIVKKQHYMRADIRPYK